jgi:hypothetical protein
MMSNLNEVARSYLYFVSSLFGQDYARAPQKACRLTTGQRVSSAQKHWPLARTAIQPASSAAVIPASAPSPSSALSWQSQSDCTAARTLSSLTRFLLDFS